MNGSNWYNHARQKLGICGFGIVTPQNKAKVMITNGFMRTAMNVEGVSAAIVWPMVTEKSSVTRTTAKLYPAREGRGLKPGMK